MSKLLMTTTAALMLAAPAFAESMKCEATDQTTWMSQEAVSAMYVEQGYDVRNIKIEAGCFEVYALNAGGDRVEMYVDPVTGEALGSDNDEDS